MPTTVPNYHNALEADAAAPRIPEMPANFPLLFVGPRIKSIRSMAKVSNKEIAAQFGGEHYILTGCANGWTVLTPDTARIVWQFLFEECWKRRGALHFAQLVNMLT